ncbi:MAG: hypothetical protein ABSE72_04570 [Bacteroidales bacterium]|jgi:hypothetical protein
MKKPIMIFFIFLLAIMSCKKEKHLMNEGKITGSDPRECICCGGYFIDINKSTYRFYELPENSGIDLKNAKFPICVELDWKKVEPGCIGDEIIIEEIEKR